MRSVACASERDARNSCALLFLSACSHARDLQRMEDLSQLAYLFAAPLSVRDAVRRRFLGVVGIGRHSRHGGVSVCVGVSAHGAFPPIGGVRRGGGARHQKKLCHHLALSSRRESPSSTQSCLPSNMRSFDLASKRSRALRGARICRARWPTHSPPLSSSVLMVGRHPWWSGRPLVVFVHSSGLSQP